MIVKHCRQPRGIWGLQRESDFDSFSLLPISLSLHPAHVCFILALFTLLVTWLVPIHVLTIQIFTFWYVWSLGKISAISPAHLFSFLHFRCHIWCSFPRWLRSLYFIHVSKLLGCYTCYSWYSCFCMNGDYWLSTYMYVNRITATQYIL